MKTLNPVVHARQIRRLLACALRLFGANGYTETSMDQIARSCGMRKASLYHYFKSKEAILRELIRLRFIRIHSRIASRPRHRNLEEMLFHRGLDYLRRFEEPENRCFLRLLMEDGGRNPHLRRLFYEVGRQTMQEARRSLLPPGKPGHSRARRKGRFRVMHQYLGSLFRYGLESKIWKAGPALAFGDRDYVRSLARIFAKGIKS